MANNKSALKRIRQTKTRTERNKALKTKVKSLKRKTLEAAASGDAVVAAGKLKEFSSVVDRAVKNNLFHRNKAANLKSKASKAVQAASAS